MSHSRDRMLLAGSPAEERGAKVKKADQATIKCSPRLLSSELTFGQRGASSRKCTMACCDL